ncbi:STAS domain-containing protein [Amycolatopsis sp. NPDC049691]|uniref:STAS domain-containing protein n=1 Tax=Amycolatopsis sp. NPDC049691 TaxID=3155155 RepID=UPI003437C952
MTGDVEVLPMDAEQALVLRLSGTLDTGTATAALARLLDSTVTLPPPHLVILDLWDVGTLSAAGVRALGEFAVRRARGGVRSAVLLDPGALNTRIPRGALPGDTLPVHASVDEAIDRHGAERTSEDGSVSSWRPSPGSCSTRPR